MQTIVIQAIQLILALSFLVLIHELGHFTFARIFHVRVEKFYMFFNPQFSILRAKKINGKWRFRFFAKNVEPASVEAHKDEKGNPVLRPMTDEELSALPEDDWRRYPDNTEWGIGWLPFGGYCAIAGMVDETKSTSDLPSEPQDWEFRSKPAWQRLLIILGGILVNFIGAIAIFTILLWHYGSDSLPLRNVNTGLYYSEVLQNEGFQQQDRILSIDGQEPEELSDVVQAIIIEGKRDVMVLRGSDTVQLTMSEDLGTRYLAIQNAFDKAEREKARADKNYTKRRYVLLTEWIPFVVDTVLPGNAAELAGIVKGDSIVAVDGVPTPCAVQVTQELQKHPCDSITMDYYRDGALQTAHLFIGDQGKIGVGPKNQLNYFELEHTDYNFWQSIPAGISYGWSILTMYVKQFRLVFTKEGAQSLGGFGAIGSMFPAAWSWYAFWHMTAFLSVILAFMNFLPIPALDGGYILFLLVEIITRRKPSDRFLEIANEVGFWLLLALLIFANGNDIFKLFF
ncbi:MAG: RIP metalloprotease RseP [Paludibacteraceae bacterium]|nr:RIP metalloprotease RseP [Paludibacteraceae bacterium]